MIAGLKPLILLVGVAAAVAAGVGVMLWSVGPTYSLLYSNLGGEDAAQITQALDSARIPYKLEDGGQSISVPAEQLAAARLKLAAQGLPEGGGGVNAITRDPGFGVSAFMESARYQHALETELARTIASLQNVQGARVHLAMARQSAFVSDRRPGSASVFLQIKAGRRLDDEQVQAIANLVASSIPELQASQVTVVDQAGRLLSAPNTDSDTAMRDKMFEFAHRLEESYAQRIQELLTPLVGPGRVRAQVVAQVDMSTTEQTREQYNPQSQVVRSESTSEEAAKKPRLLDPGDLAHRPVTLRDGAAGLDRDVVDQSDGVQEHRLADERAHLGQGVTQARVGDPKSGLLGELTDDAVLGGLAEVEPTTREPPALLRVGRGQCADEEDRSISTSQAVGGDPLSFRECHAGHPRGAGPRSG
jgi:flagellar M-ring protein FliF